MTYESNSFFGHILKYQKYCLYYKQQYDGNSKQILFNNR